MNLSELELPSNQKFGFFFTAIFVTVGAYLSYQGIDAASYILIGLAAFFLLLTVFKADFLLPLNKLWMRFGLLIGMIVRPIILGIIFFGLFTPISLLMRLFGRDELRLKLTNRSSHWRERDDSNALDDSFKNQF